MAPSPPPVDPLPPIPLRTRTLTRTYLPWLLLPVLLALGFTTQSASFTASLEPNVISLDAASTLQLRFEGSAPSEPIQIPQVPGLKFAVGGRMNETTMVNGRFSQSLVISYQVTASRVGQYTIPPITVTADARRLTSQPLTLTVAATDPAIARLAFLSLGFPKHIYYVGETTAADVDLHAQGGTLLQLPKLSGDGAIFGTNVAAGQAQRVPTNSGIYFRQTWRVPVTFTKAGNFSFRAADCKLQVDFRRQPRGNSIWSVLPDIESRNLDLSSDPVVLQIRRLPTEDVPTFFSGAVGHFTLDAKLATTNVNVGDPLTLTLHISGLGSLDAIQWSAPNDWSGLRAYDPTSRVETSDQLGLVGAKVFEQVLIPESPTIRSIPPIHFSYFDPNRAQYRTLTHPGFPLNVHAATTPAAQPLVAATSSNPSEPQIDIVHIKNRTGPLAVTAPPLASQPWFLALQLLPPLAWLASLLRRRHLDQLTHNPRRVRRLQTARQVRRGLAALRQHAAAENVQPFYTELFRLLQEQLGERLDLPASSIAGEIVEQRLRAPHIDPSLADAVDELFHRCDQARYTPQAAQDIHGLLPKAESTLRQLQRLPLLLFLTLFATFSLQASTNHNGLLHANRLYEQGQYQQAATQYRALLEASPASPTLHFNLGNARFRLGQLGHAIAHYRLASELDPRDPDIAANLHFARQQVPGNASIRPDRFTRTLHLLRFSEWTLLTSASLWIFFGLLTLRQLRPTLSSRLRPWTIFASIITLTLISLTTFVWYRTHNARYAIVTQPELPLRYGPFEESQVHYTVPDGTELLVGDRQGEWAQLIDAARRSGWARYTNLFLLPP